MGAAGSLAPRLVWGGRGLGGGAVPGATVCSTLLSLGTQADYELSPDEKRKEMGEEIIRRFLKQEVSPGGALGMGWEQGQQWGAWGGGSLAGHRATSPALWASQRCPPPSRGCGWDAGAMPPGRGRASVCSPRQSPDFLPEVGQPHASRCLQDLQKSPCKDLFSSCLR